MKTPTFPRTHSVDIKMVDIKMVDITVDKCKRKPAPASGGPVSR